MNTDDIKDRLIRKAVEAIDAGDTVALKRLIDERPSLIKSRLPTPDEQGYFKDPYLLWFIADNPIRNATLAINIVGVTNLLINEIKLHAAETAQLQLDYALALVATGRIPRECGVQIELMDLLIDAGAKPGSGKGALAEGNIDAAAHLIKRGGNLTLSAAVGLRRPEDIERLFVPSTLKEKATALTVAAFYGMADIVSLLLEKGVSPNNYPDDEGFHSHGTPLHQAVSSGSLETVKLLVDAGANLNAVDKIFNGTPLAWAQHMRHEASDETVRKRLEAIEAYLKEKPQSGS